MPFSAHEVDVKGHEVSQSLDMKCAVTDQQTECDLQASRDVTTGILQCISKNRELINRSEVRVTRYHAAHSEM